jgi:hypothetical protein
MKKTDDFNTQKSTYLRCVKYLKAILAPTGTCKKSITSFTLIARVWPPFKIIKDYP